MGFLDLFRPKWKHSDPAVRIEAVKEFTAEDDASLLAQVVRQDSDARVRRTALKKIADPGLLDELAQRDPDESLRKDAADKAVELLVSAALQDGDEARALTAVGRISAQRTLADIAVRSSLESVRSAALRQISDDRCRAEVVRRGTGDSALRTRALAAITDTDILRDLACSDAVKEVVVMAVGKLTERETLEAVLRKAKSKAARSAAQEKLDAMSPQPAGKAVGTSPAPRAPRVPGALVVFCGDAPRYAACPLTDPQKGMVLGRDVLVGLGIHDERISRQHVHIEFKESEGCFLVRDLGSRNGSFLNAEPLRSGVTRRSLMTTSPPQRSERAARSTSAAQRTSL